MISCLGSSNFKQGFMPTMCLLVIMPAHHSGSYRYVCPPIPVKDNGSQNVRSAVWNDTEIALEGGCTCFNPRRPTTMPLCQRSTSLLLSSLPLLSSIDSH
jgi:hypothetical protein